MLDEIVQITFIVSHDNVEELPAFLECSIGTDDFHHKITLQHAYNLYFSIFVFWILKDLLNCDYLACLFEPAFIDLSKGTLANDFHEIDVI